MSAEMKARMAAYAATEGLKFLDTEGLKYFRQKLDERYISAGERGAASGVATLDANGKLNSSQIPTGLDDYIPVDTLPKSGMQENVFYYVITGGDADTAQISLGTAGHTYRYVGGEGAHWVDISSIDTATKALQDADGNVISTTYVKVQAGKQLSTEDYTTAEKEKLAGLHNYTLPEATADTLGGVKVGAGLTVASGVLSAEVKAADIADFITAGEADAAYVSKTGYVAYSQEEKEKLAGLENYTLPVAGDALGGIKNGGNVVVGVDGAANVELPDIAAMTTTEIDAAFAD